MADEKIDITCIQERIFKNKKNGEDLELQICSCPSSPLVLFFGKTAVGKTTTILYLAEKNVMHMDMRSEDSEDYETVIGCPGIK